MGEYVLKCEPIETKTELKEVLKFIDNPIFTSSIINPEVMYSFILIIFILFTIFSIYKINEKIWSHDKLVLLFWCTCLIVSIVIIIVLSLSIDQQS